MSIWILLRYPGMVEIGTSHLAQHISDPLLGEKPIHRHTYICVGGRSAQYIAAVILVVTGK